MWWVRSTHPYPVGGGSLSTPLAGSRVRSTSAPRTHPLSPPPNTGPHTTPQSPLKGGTCDIGLRGGGKGGPPEAGGEGLQGRGY